MNLLKNQMVAQGMTFDPAIDLRNDLVNFYGYSRDNVNGMSDDEVFDIIDSLDEDLGDDFYCVIPTDCNKCGHNGLQEKDSYDDDFSCLHCPKCKHDVHLHYTAMDGLYEMIDED